MVRPSVIHWSLAILAALGAGTASAAPINFSGFVERDFDSSNRDVRVTSVSDDPAHIGQSPWITQRGWSSGFSIKDIRSSYDESSDTLYVGVNTFGIAGDADGNGNPGGADPLTTANGGVDPAHLGGDKSITVAFAPNGTTGSGSFGTPVVVAGVPTDKSAAGPGLNGFTVASFKNPELGLGSNYGALLPEHQGVLAFDPSPEHPGFEFTIRNFSKIPGIDPTQGYWISAYAGSTKDVVVGEDSLSFTRVPRFSPQSGPEPTVQSVPEPTTFLAWSIMAGGAAWSLRKRRGASK